MSSSTLHLRKTKKKAVVASSLIIAASAVGPGGYKISNEISGANAAEQSKIEKPVGGYIFNDIPVLNLQVETKGALKGTVSVKNDIIGATSLPASYDSRALGYVSRQEDQAGEGLCWAYSFTTAAESYLLRTGLVSSAFELSPKQLDYALAPASQALSDSMTNKYEDYVYGVTGQHRSLTDGSNFFATLSVVSGKYSLTGDDSFFSRMKANDSTVLGSFNSYGDFITNRYELAYADYLANGSTNLPITYTTKQKTADVFNKNDAEYAVTGADFIILNSYAADGMSQDRTNAIAEIKNNIKEHGAVAIASHYSEDKCMYKDGQNYTIIDRTTNSALSECDSLTESTGHGMTLVGWDDTWAYKDNNVDKTGAFIVQNSYGNDGIKYYFSYNSYINATAITDIQPTSSFTNIYDVSDFTKTVNADEYEVVFDYAANGTQKLTEIAAFINPMTGSSDLGWDFYVKSGNGQYSKVGKINDDANIGLHNLKNLDIDLNGNFSIKIKYNNAGYTIVGLTPELFAEEVAPIMTAVAYTGSNSSTPGPTPADDEPTGAITWIQGQNYEIGSNEDLIVKIDYPLSFLVEVDMDGKALTAGDFKVESGSTVLTIYGTFLDTLEAGIHTIQLLYGDKTIEISFTVIEGEDVQVPNTSAAEEPTSTTAPETGKNTNSSDANSAILSYALPILIAASALGYFAYRRKKQIRFFCE